MPQHAPRPHGTWIPQVPATRDPADAVCDPVIRIAVAAIVGALLVLSAGIAVAYPCECPQGAVAPREEVAPVGGHPVVRELCDTDTPTAQEMCDLVTRPTAGGILDDLHRSPETIADVIRDANGATSR